MDRQRCLRAGMRVLSASDLLDADDGPVAPLFERETLSGIRESGAAQAARVCLSGAIGLVKG